MYLFFCPTWMFMKNHSVVLLLSVFLPEFDYGSLGTHPTSVNENLFMQPSFSIAYQQLNVVFPVPHPNVSIYNINKQFLSSSQHCRGVYICVGHLTIPANGLVHQARPQAGSRLNWKQELKVFLVKPCFCPNVAVSLNAWPSLKRSPSELWGSLISWNILIYWPLKKKKEETLFGLLCFLENFFFHN